MGKDYNCLWCDYMSSNECGKIVSENFNGGSRYVKKMDKRCVKKKEEETRKRKKGKYYNYVY